jgi:hypothetical protein
MHIGLGILKPLDHCQGLAKTILTNPIAAIIADQAW